MGKTKNKLFLGLLTLSALLIGALVFFILYTLLNLENRTLWWVLVALGISAAALVALVLSGVIAAALSARAGRPIGAAGRLFLRMALRLYPLSVSLGQVFGVPKDRVQDSFIEMNNRLVRSGAYALEPGQVVVLAPHCLQHSGCTQRITQSAENCTGCGNCDIAALRGLCAACGVPLVVVTGGTLARNYIRELRPRAVVAVACERDLSSGILDVMPLPSLGVKNIRPEGPCKNTRVDISSVKEAIRFFLPGNGDTNQK